MEKYVRRAKKITDKKYSTTASSSNNSVTQSPKKQLPSEAENRSVYPTVDENFGFLSSIISSSIGLTQSKYEIPACKLKIGITYISSIVDKALISDHIIKPIAAASCGSSPEAQDTPQIIQSNLIHVAGTKKGNKMSEVVDSLFLGCAIVFSEGSGEAEIVNCRKIENRSIEIPNNEVTVLAAMDSFNENLDTNCSLIIRRLPTPDLHFEEFIVGRLSRTKLKLVWLDGISNPTVVNELRNRLGKIDVDVLDGIGRLADFIVEEPLSIFPNYRQTQRPDVVTKKLTDGFVAVLCDNSPFALVAPMLFVDIFKTMDDYSENTFVASFLRLIRVFAFFLATTISGFYLAFVTYNQTIVPAPLAVNIATGRDGIPFPSIVEVLILSLAISIIREASLRLPGSVGYFIGTLAAVVIGQAAVTAGYVSASVIIVIAVTAISSYAISNTTMVYPARLINYMMILFAGIFGMFGIMNGIILIIWHLVSLRSFGIPFLYPIVPFDGEAMKDGLVRLPFSITRKRSKMLVRDNEVRFGEKGINNKSGR